MPPRGLDPLRHPATRAVPPLAPASAPAPDQRRGAALWERVIRLPARWRRRSRFSRRRRRWPDNLLTALDDGRSRQLDEVPPLATADERVGRSDDAIVAGARANVLDVLDPICAAACARKVVAGSALDQVCARVAEERVVIVAAAQRVVALLAREAILAEATADDVVPATAEDRIAASRAIEALGGGRA